MDPLIVVFGLGVGILVGTTGMGGGSLMTPLLILVVGVKPVVAVGTDLAYAAVTKTVGGWRVLRQGTVDLRISTWLAFGSVPGALGGVWALQALRHAYGSSFDSLMIELVAGALLLTGSAVLARIVFLPDAVAREREIFELERRHKVFAVGLGLVIGLVLGVTSAGSGSLIAIGLILFFRLTPRRVIGTDIFHAAILLWVAAAAHLVSGDVNFHLTANILIGSIPGVWAGTHLLRRLPASGLRPALAIVLLASGLALLSKAGAAIPVAVIIVAPLALGALTWLAHIRNGSQRAGAAIAAGQAAAPLIAPASVRPAPASVRSELAPISPAPAPVRPAPAPVRSATAARASVSPMSARTALPTTEQQVMAPSPTALRGPR